MHKPSKIKPITKQTKFHITQASSAVQTVHTGAELLTTLNQTGA